MSSSTFSERITYPPSLDFYPIIVAQILAITMRFCQGIEYPDFFFFQDEIEIALYRDLYYYLLLLPLPDRRLGGHITIGRTTSIFRQVGDLQAVRHIDDRVLETGIVSIHD